MSLYKTNESNYRDNVRVVNGKLAKQVPEGTEGAVKRTFTVVRTGEEKTVWELLYPAVEGAITHAAIKDLEFGQVMEVVFKDPSSADSACVSFPFPGRLADAFIQRIVKADLTKPVGLHAGFDKERNTNFVWLTQGGQKLTATFTKNDPNGCPEMVKKIVAGKPKWDSEARTDFLYNQFINLFGTANNTDERVPQSAGEVKNVVDTEDDEVPF